MTNKQRGIITVVLVPVLAFMLGLATMYTADYLLGVHDTNRTARVVKHVCDYSRGIDSGQWEDACGMAQNEGNAEYLCNNLTPSATCWVETK